MAPLVLLHLASSEAGELERPAHRANQRADPTCYPLLFVEVAPVHLRGRGECPRSVTAYITVLSCRQLLLHPSVLLRMSDRYGRILRCKIMAAFQSEDLVKLVKDNPCLYNRRHVHYRNNEAKTESWNQIGSYFGLSGRDVMKKWTSIRDRYKRTLNKVNVSIALGTHYDHKWKLYDTLNEMLFENYEAQVGPVPAPHTQDSITLAESTPSPPSSVSLDGLSLSPNTSGSSPRPEVIVFSDAAQLRSIVSPTFVATTGFDEVKENRVNLPRPQQKRKICSSIDSSEDSYVDNLVKLFGIDLGRRIRAMPADQQMQAINIVHQSLVQCEMDFLAKKSRNNLAENDETVLPDVSTDKETRNELQA